MADPTTSSSTDASALPVVANFRLPAFSTTDASIWFRRAEVQFRLKKITRSTVKADHVLAAIPDTLFPKLAEWLDAHGTSDIEYDDLKAHLLQKFTLKPEQRVKQIFALAKLPLGDQRPSDALTELRALARLPPNASGTPQSIDVLLALWLTRLPEAVRAGIKKFSDYSNDDAIAREADALLDAHLAASRPSFVSSADLPAPQTSPSPTPPDDPVAQASAYRRPRFQPSAQRQFQPSPPQPRQKPATPPASSNTAAKPTKPFNPYCFYHSRYGPRAQKCQSPCSWSS